MRVSNYGWFTLTWVACFACAPENTGGVSMAGGASDEIASDDPGNQDVANQPLPLEGITSTLLKNIGSGLCLDVPRSATTPALHLIQYGCHSEANQLFELRAAAVNGYLSIVSKVSGQCVDIYGESLLDGAAVIQYPCNGDANQLFQLRSTSSGLQLVAKHSLKCVVPVSGAQGAELIQKTCSVTTSDRAYHWATQGTGGGTGGGAGGGTGGGAPQFGGLTRSGRNFMYNGQPIILLGWDTQELASNPAVDYTAKLDGLKANGINKVRLWIYSYWNPNFIHPWVYINGMFDLERFNEAYWTRLKSFLAAARARSIIVELSIFSPNAIDQPEDWSSTQARLAFNQNYNLNGAFAANSAGHFNPEFHTLGGKAMTRSGKTLQMIQQALVDKTLAETSSFDNVYYEVSNEFPGANTTVDQTYPWALYWARYIKQRTARLVGVHAHQWFGMHNIGLSYFMSEPSIDILTFHAGNNAVSDKQPTLLSDLWHPAQNKNKILQTNEGMDPYIYGLNGSTNHALSYLMSGASFALYEDDATRVGSAISLQGSQRLKVLQGVVTAYDFPSLSPVDANGVEFDGLVVAGPAPSWQVLARPGSRYAIYFTGPQSSTRARIKVASGSFTCAWIDPRSGASVLKSPCTSSAGFVDTPAPSLTSWDRVSGLLLVITQ